MSQTEKFIDFALRLPPTVNPYYAVAQALEDELASPPTPTWARWVEGVIMVAFFVMFLQAGYFIYLRIKARRFDRIVFNKFGLLRINVANVSAIGYASYSGLVIVDIIFQKLVDTGKHEAFQVFLFGAKCLVITEVSWAFLWAYVCHGICLKWERSLGNGKDKIPLAARWALHMIFLCAVIWPVPTIMWAYAKATSEYININDTITFIVKRLMDAGDHYSPETPSDIRDKLESLLVSGQQIPQLSDSLASYTQTGIRLYLLLIILMCLLYVPLLAFSLKPLYHRTLGDKTFGTAFERPDTACSLQAPQQKTRKQRNALIQHFLLAFTSTLAHAPVLIWQISYKGDNFLNDTTWRVGSRLGLHGPFAILGNLTMLILIRDSRRFLKGQNAKEQSQREEKGNLPQHTPSQPLKKNETDQGMKQFPHDTCAELDTSHDEKIRPVRLKKRSTKSMTNISKESRLNATKSLPSKILDKSRRTFDSPRRPSASHQRDINGLCFDQSVTTKVERSNTYELTFDAHRQEHHVVTRVESHPFAMNLPRDNNT